MASVHPNNEPGDDFIMPALPAEHISLEGYDEIGVVLPPAQTFDYNSLKNLQRPTIENTSSISEEDARQALAQFVSEHCCYGSGPVKELEFTNLSSSETNRYALQTFTESRTTAWKQVPHRGNYFPNNGNPPGPWQIECHPGRLFADEVRNIEIPNTSRVERCARCGGDGKVVCWSCNGRRSSPCFSCNGSGCVNREGQSMMCGNCHGSGHCSCMGCSGSGQRTCSVCQGCGSLRWYLELTVTFHNYMDDFLKDSVPDDIPDKVVRECVAKNVFTEQNQRVVPITHHTDPDINKASVNLIGVHQSTYGNMKILGQKHDVTVIPITLCKFVWDEEPGDFYVYGLDHRVYAPNYPKKCCCTIL